MTDILPNGYTFQSATESQGTYDEENGIWTVGDLEAGGEATLEILVTVLSVGDFENTAEITAVDQPDPNSTPDNNEPLEDDQASAGLLFTLSIDDLVIASFASGPGASTLPMVIFSKVRLGVSPEVNALATIIIGIVALGVIAATILQFRRPRASA